MTFAAPIWLYLTLIIICLMSAVLAYGLKRRDTLLEKFVSTRLLNQLTEKAGGRRMIVKAALLLLGLAGIGLALARPQYGIELTERKARNLDIIFVLDSSKSMLATDLRPTRLDRAKLAILDLINHIESDRIGLVAFAGRAFLQTPPTLDYSAFRESLESISPQTISRGGSDIGNAIREAAKAFPSRNNVKVVVLLTDGEDLRGEAVEAATAAAEEKIKLYVIGIGTPEGEYLRIRTKKGTKQFVRNDQGEIVRSRLDETTLRKLAKATGGHYSRLSNQSLDQLYHSFIANLPREERKSEVKETAIDHFQWALAAACLFLVLEILIRRRGNSAPLTTAIALAAFFAPVESNAQDKESIVPTPLTNPSEKIKPELPPEDQINTSDERELYNMAQASLSDGDFEKAKLSYTEALSSIEDLKLQQDALYNMAHATFQTGEAAFRSQNLEEALREWKEAEKLFQSAHEINPADTVAAEDAQLVEARRKALEEFLKQQEEQQGSGSGQGSGQKGKSSEEPTENPPPPDQAENNDKEVPLPNETFDEEEGSGTAPDEQDAEDEAIEGMRISEAQILLDSLREDERLLPFTDRIQTKTNDNRDW